MRQSDAPPSRLNQAEVAGAISAYYHVPSGDQALAKLLAVIFPDVERAAAADPGSWRSVFPGVLAKYESMARDMGLGLTPGQREANAVRHANATAAATGFSDFTQFAARSFAGVPLALREDSGGGSRADRTLATRDGLLSVNSAISFAREIGVSPGLSGFFVGGSLEMRDALRSAIHEGTAITDDKVKSMKDVGMVIGAIRAGKLSPNDPRIPSSVREVLEDMKKNGVDPVTADPRKVRKYLDKHPDALRAAKRQITQDQTRDAGKTEDAKRQTIAAGTKATSTPRAKRARTPEATTF